MSWTGTVTCSHCYKQGHNQRGCLGYKKHLKDSLLEAKKDENEYRIQHFEHLLKETSSRKCSYCKNSYVEGDAERHSKATCPSRRENIANESKTCLSVRKALKERWRELGFGVGTLLDVYVYNHEVHEYGKVAALVTGINWAKITNRSIENQYSSEDDVVHVSIIGGDGLPKTKWVPLPRRAIWMTDKSYEEAVNDGRIRDYTIERGSEIISGISAAETPSDFLNSANARVAILEYVDERMAT